MMASNRVGKSENRESMNSSQLVENESYCGHTDTASSNTSTTASFIEQHPIEAATVQQLTSNPSKTDNSDQQQSPECDGLKSPPPDITAQFNWQATCSSVHERNKAMLYNPLMADVHFNVGATDSSERIPCHRYVLATGSSVFHAMFFGGLSNSKDIDIPDVDPLAFRVLLKYLYCDEIHLEADTVLSTLYAAKKYMVPRLARACVAFLEASLAASNACLLLSQSRLFEESQLMQRCWEVIDAQASVALSSEGFAEIDQATLCMVLDRETLNCPEVEVFEAAVNWAKHECARRQLPRHDAKLWRKVLGDALYMVHMTAMETGQFADRVAQTGVLTLQEVADVFLHFTATHKPRLSFPVRPRAGLKSQVCHRFLSSAYRGNQWRYRGRCDSIQFSVDRRVFLVGLGLYGSSNGAAQYTVHMQLKRHDACLADNHTGFFSDGCSNTFHIFFTHPIQVEPNMFYTVSTVLDGEELSYFGQEGMCEVVCGAVTFQFQCSADSTNGTGVQGGQIPELIFYGPESEA